MSQANFTPISLYYSTTASAVPTAANLVPGELAINTNDGKLYYEDSSGVVQVLATKSTGSIGGSNTQVQFNNSGSLGGSSGLTWDGSFLTTSSIKNTALTSGRVTYAGASGLLTDSTNLLYSGGDLTVYGLTVGRGGSAISTNTALGYQAGNGVTGGIGSTFIGYQAGLANVNPSYNINIGYRSGYTSTATQSTFIGYQAGYGCTGVSNTFVGPQNDSTGQGSGQLMGTGNYNTILGAFTGNQSGLDIRTASNYIVLSDGVGNPLISTNSTRSVALNGAVPQTGTGITFPATQSASSDANTLDDYEEGTWTPTVTAQTGSYTTVTDQAGSYTKIGRQVTINWFFIVSVKGTGLAGASISNLPFASNVSTGNDYSGTGSDTSQAIMQLAFMTATTSFGLYSVTGTDPIFAGRGNFGTMTYFV
jgi:hypothetical protein